MYVLMFTLLLTMLIQTLIFMWQSHKDRIYLEQTRKEHEMEWGKLIEEHEIEWRKLMEAYHEYLFKPKNQN